MTSDPLDFEAFVADAEPALRRALIGAVGTDRASDAVAEALAYAWENWARVSTLENPIGYLYRVGQSKARRRKVPKLRAMVAPGIPEIEPGLPMALMQLPLTQRSAVWLAHGCEWTHREIAEALEVSPSTVATHVSRGLETLRRQLGVEVTAVQDVTAAPTRGAGGQR